MRIAIRLVALAALAALLAPAPRATARGDAESRSPNAGILDAFAPDGRPLGPCPLQHTDVTVEIAGFVARVRVTQTFSNPFPDPVEAVYTFPLSHRAAVDAMWLRTGEREIRGAIHRREEARAIYEQARRSGRVAALLDEERRNVFTQSVANLMPGATVEVEIHYVEMLAFEAGRFEWSFPTVVGPRFVPGRPLGTSGTGIVPDTDRVPDASRITPPVTPPGTRAGHDIDIDVSLDVGVRVGGIESPLHEVVVERDGTRRARVRLARRDEIPNRDFVLRYEVSGDKLRSGTLVHRTPGEDGFASFLLLPPRRVTPRTAQPKELVFVIDRSGSQSGLPLAKAKETLLWILDRLHPRDTFQVLDFGSGANLLFERPRLATPETVARARAHVESLQANGGTYMAEAIQRVAGMPADDNRLRIVTFMTDGYVGNDREVIELVRRVRGTSRWFPFGTGNSVNRFLLDAMAREGGGEAEIVLLDAAGDEVAERFWERIASPALTDVQLEFEGLDVYDVYPREVSDVWADRPLVIHARYGRAGRGRVVVRGYRAGQPYREVLDVHLPARADGRGALASMWARARVDALLARDRLALQAGRFPEVLREQVVEVALAHGILTPFTSFVAVEERVVNEAGIPRRVAVPVEMPQGVTYEGVFGESAAAAAAPGAMRMGRLRALGYAVDVPTAEPPVSPSPGPKRILEERSAPEPRAERVGDARQRLAPALRVLLERPQEAHPQVDREGDRVKVRIARDPAAPATREALEAAGVAILQLAEGWALGWVRIGDLEALARLPGIAAVEPA